MPEALHETDVAAIASKALGYDRVQPLPVLMEEPPKITALFSGSARYRVAWGGRGGAKSWNFGRRSLLNTATREDYRVLCAREFQVSISDSVYTLLLDQIRALGLSDYYRETKSAIEGPGGSLYRFEGLARNARNIKSKEGFSLAWVEEAEKVSHESWELLIPTFRRSDSEIWVSMNRASEDDSSDIRFVQNSPPNSRRIEICYWDNPWFPEVLRAEMEHLKRVDYDAYLHVWEGQPVRRSDAQVLSGKWRVDAFTERDMDGAIGPLYGLDWGFSVDPMAALKLWIKGRRLFIEHEAVKVGVELNDIPAFVRGRIPGLARHPVHADNSRPESISHVSKMDGGLNVVAADKWPGSVEDGIAFLRAFDEIVIHDRCKTTIREARVWSYRVNKATNQVEPVLVDANNHTWDAARYALGKFIRQRDPYRTISLIHQER